MYCKYANCCLCGAVLSCCEANGKYVCQVIKDEAFNGQTEVSASQLYSSMLNDQYVTRFYNPNASYIKCRVNLIKWLKELTKKLDITNSSLHIAVAYMDYVLSKLNFPSGKFNLIALTCLIIAVKYDELDENIPSLFDFMSATRSTLFTKPNDIKNCEAKVLSALGWNLCIITPLNFLEILFTQGVVHITDTVEGKVNVETAKDITRDAKHLLDISFNSKD
jgi:hypothetical protein